MTTTRSGQPDRTCNREIHTHIWCSGYQGASAFAERLVLLASLVQESILKLEQLSLAGAMRDLPSMCSDEDGYGIVRSGGITRKIGHIVRTRAVNSMRHFMYYHSSCRPFPGRSSSYLSS